MGVLVAILFASPAPAQRGGQNTPTLAKSFGAGSISVGGSTTLTFLIIAANLGNSGVHFTDVLPEGLIVATPSGLSNSCGGNATAGGNNVSLANVSLTSNQTCTVVVNVTATSAGTKHNGPVELLSDQGPGNAANANLDVIATPPSPPIIAKSFAPSSIPLGGTSVLTITINNPNASATLTGVAFNDPFPAGLVVATPSGLTNSCGGTLTAPAGGGSVNLSGGALAVASSCTISVTVTGTTAGTKVNTTSNVSSGNGGIGNTASASLQVTALAPPGLSKRFAPALIAANGTSTLTFTINNPNPSTALTGVAFTDAFPAGLLVATPSGLTNSCGGALTAPAGGGSLNLSGATLAAATSCTISINVTGTTAGIKVNTTSPVSSTNGGTGDNASAALVVGGGGGGGVGLPPAIAKSFAPSLIPVGGASVLTFRIINPNPVLVLSGVAFTDVLPTGLQVANPTGLTGTCGGGAITATAGGGSVSLSGATLASSASCTFSVNVTGTTVGTLTNVTDPVTSTNGGTGNSAIASITIKVPEDSQRLRDLQLIVTKLEAQTSGAAVSGAIDDAIGDGFAECAGPPMPVKANGGGLRFNFGCEEQTRPRPPGMSTKAPPEVVYVPRPLQFWADVRGSDWNTSQQTGDIRGGQINALFGVTRRLAPDLLIGAFGGYENFDYTSQLLDGRLKGDGWTAGGYFGWRFLPGLRFDASLARSVINYNGVAGTAAATFPGQRWLATASLIGTYKNYGFELEPSLKVYALMEHENGYTDNLGTTQGERNFSNGRASAGAKIAYPWQWTTTVTLKPYVGVYADYYFDRDDAALPTATPLPPIQTLQGWSARVTSGLGATLADGQRLSVDGELGGLGSNQFTVWSLRGRAAIPFDAAGLPAGAYPKAVVVTSPFHDWRSGFYFGINGGGGFARKCWDLVADVFADLPGPEGCHSPSGDTLGGQIGYRLRSANWVFGVEGQGNWANFSGSNISLLFAPDSNRTRVDAFGLITGQIGYAWNNVLLYMKGGAAVTSDSYHAFSGTTGLALASARETRWGGTVGAGVEFGFAPNWSLGVEYNHLFMGTRNVNFIDLSGAFFQTESIRQGVDIGLARLNYRFGEWGAPVAARY
jgi:opacity protein-like surface antigen